MPRRAGRRECWSPQPPTTAASSSAPTRWRMPRGQPRRPRSWRARTRQCHHVESDSSFEHPFDRNYLPLCIRHGPPKGSLSLQEISRSFECAIARRAQACRCRGEQDVCSASASSLFLRARPLVPIRGARLQSRFLTLVLDEGAELCKRPGVRRGPLRLVRPSPLADAIRGLQGDSRCAAGEAR